MSKRLLVVRPKGFGKGTWDEVVKRLDTDIECTVLRSDQHIPMTNPAPYDVLFRWGWRDSHSTSDSLPTINTRQAITTASSKGTFRLRLAQQGLAPVTVYNDTGLLPLLKYPVIVRPNKHAGGRRLWLCDTVKEARAHADKLRDSGTLWYASEYVTKVAEYRVFVLGGRVFALTRKHVENKEAIAWGHSDGSIFRLVNISNMSLDSGVLGTDISTKVCRAALDACELAGLTFAGVDVMVDSDGREYVLEVNTAPTLTSPSRLPIFGKCLSHFIKNELDVSTLCANKDVPEFVYPTVTYSEINPKS